MLRIYIINRNCGSVSRSNKLFMWIKGARRAQVLLWGILSQIIVLILRFIGFKV